MTRMRPSRRRYRWDRSDWVVLVLLFIVLSVIAWGVMGGGWYVR